MSLARLQELSSLLEPAQPVQVDEAKSSASDFDGIKSIVDDCLADLSEKIGKGGALADLMKETGADKLDTEKDKDGMTIVPKLGKLVAEFKKQVESLMTEVELMVVSAAPGKVTEGTTSTAKVITEAKDYSDSGEFTDELFEMSNHIAKMKQTVRQPRWNNWMKVTDDNYDTSAAALNKDFVDQLVVLDKAFNALEDDLHSAG